MQHPYILSNCNTNYSWGQKVQKGHWRSNHGHERSYGLEQKRKVVTYDILGCSAFFWYTSCICSKMLSFEVIRGQWRSAWGQSFDLSLVWTYFHCNTAVFSFDLICNTPIFLVIVLLTILEVKRSKKVIRGQIMVMRGHMVKSRKERLSHMISLGAQLSFDIHHAYVPKC